MIEADDQHLDQVTASGTVLVCFSSPNCGPCGPQKQILGELDNQRDDVTIVTVDVEKSPSAAQRYGVRTLPTVMLIRDGDLRETGIGLTPLKKLEAMLG